MADSRGRQSGQGCDAAEDEQLTDEQERLRNRTAVALYLFAGAVIGGAVAVDGCFALLAWDGRGPRHFQNARRRR
jgi:hypothetical protein